MEERGVSVDHSTVQKWVVRYAPQLEREFRKSKRKLADSWKMDETYIKVNGKQVYRECAILSVNSIDLLKISRRLSQIRNSF